MSSTDRHADGSKPLVERVQEWLGTQGYPLEFGCAAVFQNSGFRVLQGFHVRKAVDAAPREVDVLAQQSVIVDKCVTRISHVVECKYSRDKPWVVFTSSFSRMHPAACVAQTIGSMTGETLLWAAAGDCTLHELDHFAAPRQTGFGGRQAFTNNQDQVYSALQSVTSVATLIAKQHDRINDNPARHLTYAEVAFPVVVVDGELFEAYFDRDSGQVEVREVQRVRLHWRGSAAWSRFATLDVVRYSALSDFANVRARDGKVLLSQLAASQAALRESMRKHDLGLFKVSPGPRGLIGYPRLFRDLRNRIEKERLDGGRPPAGV